ncbi:replication initiator protein A [Xenorhabdus sp. KK7.4]|uniref:replication initiator protein A n=1 Tax=Xenorhabdus sp. KK7.4 TaxID=1851572 RepID=UPI000C04B4F2|nr:replication initiator protein A [Xenorhabdus sp. KK7.4]PHM51257.1 hypothetical protein Xekk_03830 [Xenorhabdus sp. KK7.4]
MDDFIKKSGKNNLMTLRPRKYTEAEFFIADEMEIIAFRDELASMEHPFFALKGGDTKIKEYNNGNVTVTVTPSVDGMATIFDKDIWIYAISKLQQAMFEEKPISRIIAFTPYDYLVSTNREIGGNTYKNLKESLRRLSGTRIETNVIYSEEKKKTENFGLIDKWHILEEKKGNLDIGMIEITLPDWLYQSVTKAKVLKISNDYFRIRKAIDRRLYEIARKHCGYSEMFTIALEKLHLKSGSTALIKGFRHSVKQLSKTNDLPDYEVIFDIKKDSVTFKNKKFDPAEEKKARKRTEKNKEAENISKIKSKLQERFFSIRHGGK